MAIRMTGLSSGLDTETIISQLVEAHKTKVNVEKKKQTKLEWKKEAWSSLNTKLYNFYTGSLANFKSAGTYNTKKVTSSNDSKVSFSTSNNAIKGTHSLSVKSVATSAYLTGAKLGTVGKTTTYDAPTSSTTKLSDIVDSRGNQVDFSGTSFEVSHSEMIDDKKTTVTDKITLGNYGSDATIDDVITDINNQLGVRGIKLTASYNEKTGGIAFSNTSANEVTDEDGKTKYENGTIYSIKSGSDATNALGMTKAGVSVESLATSKTKSTQNMSIAFRVTNESALETPTSATSGTKLIDMGITAGTTFTINVGGTDKTFTTDGGTTVANLAAEFSKMGVTASFDAAQGRFFINSADTGLNKDFTITSSDSNALNTLGMTTDSGAIKTNASDAIVVYNGAEFKQSTNAFSLNGLNFTVKDVTVDAEGKDTPISVNVATDTQAVYDAVKNFVKEYNALIKEMNTLYGADSAKDYDPLTSDEKAEMSEDEIKEWESKIKDSLLRRDSTISGLLSTMRTTLNKSVNVTLADGTTKKYSLSSFGINTGIYTENGMLHIDGDADDSYSSGNVDKLMEAIMSNPEAVMQTLSGLGTELYTNFQKAMKSSEGIKSALTFYNDKQMDKEITNMKNSIKKLQEKLTKQEDRYYDQFASMETAMAKLQSQQSYISQLFSGGN